MTASDHERAFELLPWLVNGTLAPDERASVEAHVRDCVACRIALREQQQLQLAITSQATVPLSPSRGFEALQRELERRAPGRPRRLSGPFAPLAALAAAALGVAALTLLLWLSTGGDRAVDDGSYVTLTSGLPPTTVDLDVVFASSTTENEMRALLGEIDATIVGGPSEIGRYRIRVNAAQRSDADIAALVERLRHDDRVRFVGRSLTEAVP